MNRIHSCLCSCLVATGLAVCFFAPALAHAATESITVTHTYVMGDSESKNEARANCLAEAKRRIAEQAGAYVEVMSKTRNFQMEEDEVLSFTAALVRVTVDQEDVKMDGGNLAITLTVTGEVDPDTVQERMDELAARRVAAMDKPAIAEQPALSASPKPQDLTPHTVTAQESTRPAQVTPVATRTKDPYAAKNRLQRSLEEDTRLCVALTEKGMARSEVEHLLGRPRLIRKNSRLGYSGAKYGNVWVVYNGDEVACVRSRLENNPAAGGDIHCRGFAFNFVTR